MAAKKDRPKSTPTESRPAAGAVAAPATATVAARVATAPQAAVAVTPRAAVVEPAVRDRSTVIALIESLRNPEADVARDAAATLGRLPADAEAVDALCNVVRNADDYFHPVVRAAAAAALGQLKDVRAIDALVHATRDAMAEASEEAVKALGLLGDARALPALAVIVQNNEGFFLENVRRTAQEATARIQAGRAKA